MEDNYIHDDLPDVKYDGYNFNILSCYFYSRNSANLMMFDEMTGDPVNDVLYNAKCNVEDRFDVSVTWTDAGGTTATSAAFRNSVAAQDRSFDLCIGNDTETATLTKEGMALNRFEIEAFNTEKALVARKHDQRSQHWRQDVLCIHLPHLPRSPLDPYPHRKQGYHGKPQH